jgi:type 1 fimbria pilin
VCIILCIRTGAIACTGTTSQLTIPFGTITDALVGKVAVGGVITKIEGKWDTFGTNASATCGTTSLVSYTVSGNPTAGFTNIYDTNLQGIGIRISVWTVGQSNYGNGGGYYGTPTTPTPIPIQLPVQNLSGNGVKYGTGYNQIRVELIRTASNWQGGTLSFAGPILTVADQAGTQGTATISNISINGALNLAGCNVTTKNLIVNLGSVRMPDVISASNTGTDFTIEMICSANPSLSIQFDGVAVANNPKILKLRDDPAVATGIGLQIRNSAGEAVTIGEGIPLINAAPDGINQFHFTARYVPTAAHKTPGTADANATFTMQYN